MPDPNERQAEEAAKRAEEAAKRAEEAADKLAKEEKSLEHFDIDKGGSGGKGGSTD